MNRPTRFIASLALLAIVSNAAVSRADYVIDEGLSSLQLNISAVSGSFVIDVSTPQLPGSDIAIPTGTIAATRVGGLNGTLELTGGNFGFLDYAGGNLEPAFNPDGTDISPHVDPPGSAPAAYGFDITVINASILQGGAAIRNVFGELTSGVMNLTAGAFNGTQVTVGIPSAHADLFIFGPGLGTLVPAADNTVGSDLTGLSSLNTSPVGAISVVGLTEILTLTVNTTFSQSLNDIPVQFALTGTIVATRTVPEPSTVTLLLAGAVGIVVAGRRRWKR
jgi:hypothetical protein